MEIYKKGTFIEPFTDAWHQSRLGHFTSSEWNKLFQKGRSKDQYFGTGALTYIDEKVAELMTGTAKEMQKGLPAIDWGLAHEQDAADWYDLVTGYKSIYSGFYEYSRVFGGSPDREVNSKLITEIKCPHISSNFIAVCKINSGEEYKKYDQEKYAQCQGNILVTETEACDMIYFDPRMGAKTDGSFDPYSQGKIIKIYRDQDFINEGLERLDFATELMIDKLESIIEMQNFNRTFKLLN